MLIMLVNRLLRESGYMFMSNIDLRYLKMLVNLGSCPIIIKIQNNQRYFSFIEERDLKYIQSDIFNYCGCTIQDIKRLLYFLKTIPSTNIIFWHPSTLQAAVNFNIK